ncbi:histidine kinase [Paenibacillus sp. HWE-109]|uniref:sensor histidine kinase n=1 Tax=Paenibacillus sp. HWE-109 TaxID=1306526 RepID=UPI001EDE27C7|nr:histidine kinase [Paenibacillus sp. HWE-109]UKS28722.1 histidine kinase [Paenibacillus sp. HWE-109]
MNLGKRRFSILGKLILTFLIVISPMYVIGTRINEWGAQLVRNEISKSLQSQIQFYRTSLENEIDRMGRIQRQYVNDEDLVSLSVTPESLTEYQKLVTVKRFQQRLVLLKESSIYIAKASVYIPPINKIISSEELAGTLPRDRLDALKRDATSLHKGLFYLDDDRLYMREYYPSNQLIDGRDPVFVLELELSIPAMQKYLTQISSYELGGAAIVKDDWDLVNTQNNEAYAIISKTVRESMTTWRDHPSQATPVENHIVTVGKQRLLTVAAYSSSLDLTVLAFVPEKAVMGPLEHYQIYLWLISFIALIVIVLFSYYVYRIIHRPLSRLVRAFRKVESGDLQVELTYKSSDEFNYLYEQFNNMVAHLKKLIFEIYEQKIRAQQSELKQLQSQINPHFLYNSFYLLYRMTKAHDFDNSTRFTKFLGDYFQYMTRNGSEEVPLERELSHVRAFAEIQTIRYMNRITFTMDPLPEACKMIIVPRLILQPIVENAYHHGFDLDHTDRHLRVYATHSELEDGMSLVAIHVEDNGQGMTEEELRTYKAKMLDEDASEEITGMLNVHRRLRLRFGDKAGVHLASREGGGLIVSVCIPFSYSDNTMMNHD